MKKQWDQFPFVLRRKILLTALAGLASLAVSLVIFTATTDHILLALGGIIFIACGRYEVVEGVCTSVTAPALHRYRKVQLVDAQGAETTLLLSKASRFRIGSHYRFYFQTGSRPAVGNDYLDVALSTNSFLGYEELETTSSVDENLE